MSKKVVNLHKKNPDETLIALLEDLLASAKMGDLTAFAGIGKVGDKFGSFSSARIYDDIFTTLGQLQVLQRQIERGIEWPDVE